MANYAIGDIQGCYDEFLRILDTINFDSSSDKIWLSGDLVNRGPNSLKCLELAYSIKEQCNIVLGNHDLHLMAVIEEVRNKNPNDTFEEILLSDKKNLLMNWLSSLPLIHKDHLITETGEIEFIMTHAGIPPHWSLDDALMASKSVEDALKEPLTRKNYLTHMYDDSLIGSRLSNSNIEALRVNTNYLTRMRFCSKDNKLDLGSKGPASKPPKNYQPWFNFKLKILNKRRHLLFGHWAALQGKTNIKNITALDTGCVWGYHLKAFRLEDCREFKVYAVN